MCLEWEAALVLWSAAGAGQIESVFELILSTICRIECHMQNRDCSAALQGNENSDNLSWGEKGHIYPEMKNFITYFKKKKKKINQSVHAVKTMFFPKGNKCKKVFRNENKLL